MRSRAQRWRSLRLAAIVASLALGVPLLLAGCAVDDRGPTAAVTGGEAGQAAEPPLPPGSWKTVHRSRQDIPHGVAQRAIWISRDQDVIDRAVLEFAMQLGRRWEFQPRQSCASADYFSQVTGVPTVDTGECWHVRAVNLGTAGDPHPVNLILAEFARSHDLYLPAVMVGVRFIRYHEGRLLQLDYLWNADLLLPPPPDRVWTPADWSNDAVAADPAKRTIMRTLQRWGQDWEPKVAATLPF